MGMDSQTDQVRRPMPTTDMWVLAPARFALQAEGVCGEGYPRERGCGASAAIHRGRQKEINKDTRIRERSLDEVNY